MIVKRFSLRLPETTGKTVIEVAKSSFDTANKEPFLADEIKSLAEMKAEARAGINASLAESVSDSTATTVENGSSPVDGAKPSEDVSSESDKPEDKTSTSSGSDGEDPYWGQYKDDEARKKAFRETKEYAADLARQLREAKAGKPESTESRPEEKKETVSTDKSSSEAGKTDLSVDEWINQSLGLKEGHTDDQLRVAQVNYEVLKFHKEVLLPSVEAEKSTRENLKKSEESVRDQKVVVNRFKKMVEGNSIYQDDLKEAENELRQLEKAHTDARLDWREAKDKLSEADAEERSKRANGRAFAHEAVERLKQKSRESKAQTERAESEKKVREESNKVWKSEFEKALKANGLEDASEKAKELLHDAAYNHVGRLAKAGKVTQDADLQPLFKDAFSPYLELKSGVPASVEKIERKRDLTDEPGPSDRKAKSGEEKPQTLAEMKAAARRGLKSSLSK